MYFTIPVRAIKSLGDVRSFARTKTLASFVSFTKELNASVRGLKLSEEIFISPLLQRLLKALSCLENTVRRCPPTGDLMRYGNVMYRDWHEQMVSSAGDLLGDILPKQNHGAIIELLPYFCNSFGNATRIDYGTGHENFFVAFLLCLSQIGVVGVADHEAIVTRVFSKYVSVTRRLQTLYRLEPAGSHGVWGLDDYYFLSFYWCVQKDQYSSLVCSSILFAGVRHN